MIEFHAEHWLHTFGGVNRVAICAAPVELPRNGAVEEIKRRGFTIDGQSYELLGVGCHMPAAPIHPGELIELLVAEVRKRAEPVNQYADKLRELGNYFWRYRNNSESALCHSAAGEIERLELVVERLWARVKEAERDSGAEIERLQNRIWEIQHYPEILQEAQLRAGYAPTNPPKILGYDVLVDGKPVAVLKPEDVSDEIERLEADRDSWQKQAEIQADSLNRSNAEVERLAARVRELEEKVITDKVLDDMSRRCLPPKAYEAMMLRRDWLLVKYDPESDFVVEVIPEGEWRSG